MKIKWNFWVLQSSDPLDALPITDPDRLLVTLSRLGRKRTKVPMSKTFSNRRIGFYR